MLVRVCRRSGRSCALAGREPPRQDDDEDTGQDGSNDVRDAVHGLCSRQWEKVAETSEMRGKQGVGTCSGLSSVSRSRTGRRRKYYSCPSTC